MRAAPLDTDRAGPPLPPASDGLASLPRRLGALLYEALLLVAMALIAGFALLPLTSPAGLDHSTLTIPPVFVRTMLFCALAGGAAVYYTWCWSNGRRTLPQKTWRIRIVGDTGAPLPRRIALLRYAAGWIGPAAAIGAYAVTNEASSRGYALMLFALNYGWALVDRERQFLHDRIAGTRVIDSRA